MKKLFANKRLRKFLFRWMVLNVIFILVKATVPQEEGALEAFQSSTAIFFYVTGFILLMTCWEFNDYLIKKQLKKSPLNLTSSIVIYLKTSALLIPLAVVLYYLGFFPLKDVINIICIDPWLDFKKNVLQAFILTTAVVFANLFYFLINSEKIWCNR